jgi:acyl transferase domain-containing protein
MMAVQLSEAEMVTYIQSLTPQEAFANLIVACVNSPLSCTISGPEDAIDKLKSHLQKDGHRAKKLTTGIAYHSSAMSPIATAYLHSMGILERRQPANSTKVVMYSSVTGGEVDFHQLSDAQYWVRNLVNPVKFSQALHALLTKSASISVLDGVGPITDLLEVGPHSTLQLPVDEIILSADIRPRPRYHSVLRRRTSSLNNVLELVGTLFCYGYPASILASNGASADDQPPHMRGCPPYPFDHSLKYWSESRLSSNNRRIVHTDYGILGRPFFDWNPLQPRWRNFLTTDAFPWIAEHVVS